MLSDIEIAENAELKDIREVAAQLSLTEDELELYGKYKAKLSLPEGLPRKAKLVLVTAINPTASGEGKTTVSIGLADGMKKLGKKVCLALREPSLGPVFGIKGGAAGGGYAQVVPMSDINLHFTGDLHAITAANNLLCALMDNHIFRGNELNIDTENIYFHRCMDMNDRELINIRIGGKGRGVEREDHFDITAASEVMAVLCLATDLSDLKKRLGNIIVGLNKSGDYVHARDIPGAVGSMAVLLKDAMKPNLVQTLEGTPAIIHGGPFANIAHGCNSIQATYAAMSLADYAVTEAGFGADLGAEKFYDILCRKSGLAPALTVIVATAQGLKMHGGVPLDDIAKPDLEGLRRGLANLDRHVSNLRSFGQTVLVAFNRFAADTDDEMELLRRHCEDELHAPYVVNDAYARGGEGAEEMARLVVDTIKRQPSAPLRLAYDDTDPLATKIEKVARQIYGAGSVSFAPAARRRLQQAEALGLGTLPVCIAKTQFSFSADAKRYGAVEGFDFAIRDAVINAGAGMIVAIAGDILRMPGLPKSPQALRIDYADGHITGLS